MQRFLRSSPQTDQQDGQANAAGAQPHSLEHREDLHLARRVERALHATHSPPLRRVEIAVCARVLTLAGRVPSYYLKQLAQTAAQSVPGIHEIRNELEVA